MIACLHNQQKILHFRFSHAYQSSERLDDTENILLYNVNNSIFHSDNVLLLAPLKLWHRCMKYYIRFFKKWDHRH